MMDRFFLDLQYALRMLRRNPAFAAVAVLVLSLGIGVNTASFGLVDALLFKPLPVAAPDELVRVASSGTDGGVSYPDYLDYQASAKSLSGLAAFTGDTLTLRMEGLDGNERVGAYLVSDNYFDVLGVRPPLGRGLQRGASDEPPGIVLSHAYWERRFGADPSVLGRKIWLNGTNFVVVGVAPEGFRGTLRGGAPQIFAPFASVTPRADLLARGRGTLLVMGRLARGVSVNAAQAEFAVMTRRLAATYPETNRRTSITVGLESTALLREAPQLIYVVVAVFGLFGLFLTLACVNLAGLVTARGMFRQREIAIRAMQGASRRAIAAQLLTESLVLAVLGCAGGLVVGVVARNLLWNRLQSSFGHHMGVEILGIDTGIDFRTTLFTVAISIGSILLFGLLPALNASRADLYNRAKEDPSSPPPVHLARLRRLVGAQVAVSAVLLACAGLLLQTVRQAATTGLGYPIDGIYIADLERFDVDTAHTSPAFDEVLTRVRSLPGVEAAALNGFGGPGYLPSSMTPGRPRQNYVLGFSGPQSFATMRIPILVGREFDEHDAARAGQVAILNQRLAEALWPGQDAVGRQLKIWDDKPAVTVIGLAKTVRSFPIGPPFYQIYLPLEQDRATRVTISVRALQGQETIVRARLTEELRRSSAALSATNVRTLADWAGSLLAIPRALVNVLRSLGAAALFLAAVGLYGVTAYMASRRVRECAVRRALGASRLSILWLLVRSAMKTVLTGLAIGSALSLLAAWPLKAALLGAAFDPVALVVAPIALAATALVAIAWPVFRAASVDAMVVLREE